jgi:hypothetical protein
VTVHPTLRRLDELGAHLAERGDVIAVLGLGSAGVEHERFDEHSDIDFFVIVDDEAKDRYLDDLDWLRAPAPVAYSFANERNGRKALFADGVFVEYAIFTVAELARLPFLGARVVWQRPDAPAGLTSGSPPPGRVPFDTVEFHLNEALTNLYVGLHRELRGERLTATRFIQSYAVDRAIDLLNLTQAGTATHRDLFEPTRRVEQAFGPDVLPLAELIPGYGRNGPAARAMLTWLRARFAVDPVIGAAIEALLADVAVTR